MRRRALDAETQRLNLTPMLDVVFIMLIFFIVTASFLQETGLDVTPPEPGRETPPKGDAILLAISAQDRFSLNRQAVEGTSAARAVGTAARGRSGTGPGDQPPCGRIRAGACRGHGYGQAGGYRRGQPGGAAPLKVAPDVAEPEGLVRVSFQHPTGLIERVYARPGDTVMACAVDNGIAGIRGQCGGACNCCTCHCYVTAPWVDRLPPAADDELELVAHAFAPAATSRLACQLRLTPALHGLEVHLPLRQTLP